LVLRESDRKECCVSSDVAEESLAGAETREEQLQLGHEII